MATNLSCVSYPDAKSPSSFFDGLQFQDYVVDVMLKEMGIAITNYSSKYYQFNKGENPQGIEIKCDNRLIDTGNISIEVAEKSQAANQNFVPSGIMRDDNTWLYIQGNRDILFIFSKKKLREIHATKKYKVWEPRPTIRTFLIPLCIAVDCCERHIVGSEIGGLAIESVKSLECQRHRTCVKVPF